MSFFTFILSAPFSALRAGALVSPIDTEPAPPLTLALAEDL